MDKGFKKNNWITLYKYFQHVKHLKNTLKNLIWKLIKKKENISISKQEFIL
jgi:hypothetical protein